MVSKKKRGIIQKPTEQAASDWVAAGGTDPDITHESKTSAPLAKSKSPDYSRATMYLPKALHKRLKMAAVKQDREISDLAEEAITQWLKHLDA